MMTTNPRLEKRILQIAAVLVALCAVVSVFFFSPWYLCIGGFLVGYGFSAMIFLSTSVLYGGMEDNGPKSGTLIRSFLVIGAFLIAGLALFLFYRLSHLFFWCTVIGLLSVGVSMMLFIVAETFGLIHTDFYV